MEERWRQVVQARLELELALVQLVQGLLVQGLRGQLELEREQVPQGPRASWVRRQVPLQPSGPVWLAQEQELPPPR